MTLRPATPSRRLLLKTGAIAALSSPFIIRDAEAQAKRIVVRDPGGPFTQGFGAAFYKPFQAATGVEVVGIVSAAEPTAEIKSMVETKNYTWNIAGGMSQSAIQLLASSGYIEKHGLDNDPAVSAIPAEYRDEYGIGSDVYATAIGYRTDKVKTPPTTWKEYWDVTGFPGRRGMRKYPVEAAAGRVPVIPGVLSPGYAEARAAGQDFLREGASALLLIAPFYVPPTQAGIAEYFRAYRAEVDCPIVFYDIPYRTKVVTEADTILDLAADGTVIGMKACNTDFHHFNLLAAGMPEGFGLLSGEDLLFPAHVALGAVGGILASASLLPRAWVEILRQASGGQLKDAVAAQRRLLPLLAAIFAETNPGPLKQAMAMIGQPIGGVLRPLREPAVATMAALRAAMEQLKAAGVL